MKKLTVCFLLILVMLPLFVSAQYYRLDDPVKLMLSDSTVLTLVNRRDGLGQYYYFPVNLRVAQKRDGTPEISFLGIKETEEGSEKKYSGGILHFLLTWGLDASQMDEADSLLKADINPEGAIWGAITLNHKEGDGEPEISGEEDSEQVGMLKEYLESRAKIPLFPGGKWAASCMFPGEEAEKIEAALKDGSLWKEGEISFSWYFEGSRGKVKLSAPLNTIFNLNNN